MTAPKKPSIVSQALVYLTKWTKNIIFFGCLYKLSMDHFSLKNFLKKTFQSLPKEMEINTKLDYSNFQLLDQPEFQNVTDRSVMMMMFEFNIQCVKCHSSLKLWPKIMYIHKYIVQKYLLSMLKLCFKKSCFVLFFHECKNPQIQLFGSKSHYRM